MKLLTLCALMLLTPVAVLAGLTPGDTAPEFTLTDTDGKEHNLQQYLQDGHVVVLEWFNPDCPFIKKHHAHAKTMNETYAAVQDGKVVWLAINSSAEGKQGYGLERNRKARLEYEMPMPVLLDPSGEVGRKYGAKTTPHMFIITTDGKVEYNGAIDDNRSADKLGQTNHVAQALHALLRDEAVPVSMTPPYGCSVKYAQ